MLIYNNISELTAPEVVLMVLIFGALAIAFVFKYKVRPTIKEILLTIAFAFLVSISTIIIANGTASGNMYSERFGWPLQYYFIARDGFGVLGEYSPAPKEFFFNLLRFALNITYWALFPVLFIIHSRVRLVSIKGKVAVIASILALIFITISISAYYTFGFMRERENKIPSNTLEQFEIPEGQIIE